MITALSLNAALAETIRLHRLTIPLTREQPIEVGGAFVACKAVNAFRTVNALEPGRHRLIVSVGGETGRRIGESLSTEGLEFESLGGERENRRTYVLSKSKREWEWKSLRVMSAADFEDVSKALSGRFGRDDLVIVSGTLPVVEGGRSWAPVLTEIAEAGARVLLDSTQAKLLVEAGITPWVVKLNRNEWSAKSFGEDKLLNEMRRCQAQRHLAGLIVTLGSRGALAVTQQGVWRARLNRALRGHAIGCGDALAGGLCVALHRGEAWEPALAWATACAAANLATPMPGEISAAAAQALLKDVRTERL